MATKKEKELTKVVSLADTEYIRAITADGRSVLIKKSDLYPVVSKYFTKGIIDRSTTLLYDSYGTIGKVYRALLVTTDITPNDYGITLLDIKDILSWNYTGNLSIVIKVVEIGSKIARIHIINNTSTGLIKSIYAYFNANNKLCFTINFNGTVNISNGDVIANCSMRNNSFGYRANNRIVSMEEADYYLAGTNTNEKGITL